jgi:NADH-quinone oxidoreductase subunit N
MIPNEFFKYIYLYLFIPEIFLVTFSFFFFIFFFCYSVIRFKSKTPIFLNLLKLLYIQLLSYTLCLLFNSISYSYSLFYFSYVNSFFSTIIKSLFVILFIIFLFLISDYLYFQKIFIIEYIYLFFISFVMCFLVINSNDFLLLYILLEIQNICIYFLIVVKRRSYLAIEAAIKYFLVSSVMMGFFLYGISICYFSSGITNFFDLELFL